jgi:hypothetical protein
VLKRRSRKEREQADGREKRREERKKKRKKLSVEQEKRKKKISHYEHQTTIVLRSSDRCLPELGHASSLPGGNFFIRARKNLHSGPLHPLLACWRLRPFLHGD